MKEDGGKNKGIFSPPVSEHFHRAADIGQGVIKTLVFDRGYWDGKSLWKLKHQYGIDFITPVKSSFIVSKRLSREAEKHGFEKIKAGLEIRRFAAVTDAPSYDGVLQAIVVKDAKASKR